MCALALCALLGLAALGCDQGTQANDPVGAPTNPPFAATLLTKTVQAGGSVVLQFNRFLNPGTVNRQTILILTASGEAFTDAVVVYDPVMLTVTLSNPGGGATWLVSGQTYQVKVVVATPTTQGLLAIDNETLPAPFVEDLTVTGSEITPSPPPQMNFCVDILPIFVSKCGNNPACHKSPSSSGGGSVLFPDGGGTFPAAGLVLDSAEGVLDTAIGKVAHGSNVGPMASASAPSCPTTDYQTCLFGIDMPIIDRETLTNGDPANSWLLYKTLLAYTPRTDEKLLYECAPYATYQPAISPAVVITPTEQSMLSNYILGREMPYPSNPAVPEGQNGTGAPGLTMQELERLRLWIQEGSPIDTIYVTGPDGGLINSGSINCNLCQEIVDASAPRGDGGSDGGADAPSDAARD